MSYMGRLRGFWTRLLCVAVASAAGLTVTAVAAPQAMASSTLNWARGVQVPLPTDAATEPGVEMHTLSCASTGNCSAVGVYRDTLDNHQGLLLTETNGTWVASKAPTPAGADPLNPKPELDGLSCPSAGNCSAVGSYIDGSGNTQGVLLTETSGTWGPATEIALPTPATNPQVTMRSVSCSSAGNCSAGGLYLDASGHQQAVLVTETAGTWGTGVQASLPPAATDPKAFVISVSCFSAGNCTAVGGFNDSSGNTQGVILSETSGTWGTGVLAPLPAGAGSNPQVFLDSLSCSSANNCVAGGSYVDSAGHGQALLLTETSAAPGTWTPTKVSVPADAATDPESFINEVSCPAAGSCSAIGDYSDPAGHSQGLVLSQTGNTWSAGSKLVLPADAAADPSVSLDSVSCFSAGNCGGIGNYNDSSGTQAMFLTETAGHWAPAVKAALPANAATNPRLIADANTVSCTSLTNCTAIVRYSSTGIYGAVFASANANPALTLAAPSTGTAGKAIAGSSVSGALASGAAPVGGIQFRVFGPQSSPPSSCVAGGTAVGGGVTVSGNGAYHPSTTFTPSAAGTYWWYAAYGGDFSDNAAASACGASMAKTVVSKAVVPPVKPPARPVVSNFKQSHSRWRGGTSLATISAKRKRPPVGTTFTLTLSQAGTVKLVFTQGKKTKGTLSMSAKKGKRTIKFQGRLSRKRRLALGRYTVTLTATNAHHATSTPKRLSFTIVR
jgi:hypothetical protein